MKVSPVVVIFLILAVSGALAGCSGITPSPDRTTAPTPAIPAQNTATDQMNAVAQEIAASVNDGFAGMKAGLADTSRSLSMSGLSGTEAEKALNANLLNYPWTLSSFVISRNGTVMAAAPANFAEFVGTDLSYQPQNREAVAKKAPMISSVFHMVEGFDAVAQSCPVFSSSGEYLGYVDVTYEPRTFLARQIGNVTYGPEYDVWVAQADGTQIYDVNEEEIGKNIVTDPLYADPALHEILVRIAAEPNGTGTYSFWDRNWNRTITKTAAWETAGIDGAAWRVVVTKETGTGAGTAVTTVTTTTVATAAAGGITVDARYVNLTNFVDRAAAYAEKHGKEASLEEFNDLNGTFIDGDLYIFAYETDGTVIALPYQQGLLGTDRAGITDANGVKFIERLAAVAREGGGSVYYIYPNPEDNYREEFKISNVKPVNDEWFVGSGIYLPELPARFNTTEKDRLVGRVKAARQYAQEKGATTAIRDFNDRNSTFADGSRYIFAYGFNGTTLALPFQPGVIGSDRTDFTDTWGVKVTAWEIAVAKSGGGFVYVNYLNPDTGKDEFKLCYVAPVDEEWLVGSGIYAEER